MPKKTKAALLTRGAVSDRLPYGRGSVATGQATLVQRPARVPSIDKRKLKIADDFDKMSKSELAEWYGPKAPPN
jgi:hypothetical protein